MSKRGSTKVFLLIAIIVLGLVLSGCSTGKYQTKPDYNITEQVTMSFMDAYIQGDLARAMEHVAEEVILSTDSGQMQGKETVNEMLRLNIEKDNTMEITDKNKVDNSKIKLKINNKIPLFQLAGVDVVKTLETFEVQDSKIVKWEIKHLKESVDLVEKVSEGTTGLEAEVKGDKIIVTKVMPNSPAYLEKIEVGDEIVAIDGTELKDMKYGAEEIPYRLIGEVGSKVKIKISSPKESYEVELKRMKVKN